MRRQAFKRVADRIHRRTEMRDKETLHRKAQELIDCFATTDPLKEMSSLSTEEDQEEAPLKWLALAVLHGINANAEKISIRKAKDGKVRVFAEYRESELPSPGAVIGEKIFATLRGITHLEGEKNETVLTMGVREGSVDLRVKIKRAKSGQEKITVKFPG
jgi:hypothetical protein